MTPDSESGNLGSNPSPKAKRKGIFVGSTPITATKSTHQDIFGICDIFSGDKYSCGDHDWLLDIDTGFERFS